MIKLSDPHINGDLQKAVDLAIIEREPVYVDRNVVLDKPVMIADFRNGKYNQVSIEIIGDARMWDTGKKSVIVARFTDAPVINWQKAKGIRISGLYIKGEKGIDSRYALQAGFSSDSVSGVVPPDGGYPGLREFYKGDLSKGGSTGCTIDNCTVDGLQAGIVTSINGHTQNGEIMTYQNLRFIRCTYGIVGCQAQEKQNEIYNVHSWSGMKVMFLFSTYGERSPGRYNIRRVGLADSVDYLVYRKGAGWPALHIDDVFAERLMGIGEWNTQRGDTLSNADLHFRNPEISGFPNAHLTGNGLRIKDSTLTYFGMKYPVLLAANRMEFDNTNFDGPTPGWYNKLPTLSREEIIPVEGRASLRRFANAEAGDILIFSKLGNNAYMGMGEIESITDKINVKYISPQIQGTLNISKYEKSTNSNSLSPGL